MLQNSRAVQMEALIRFHSKSRGQITERQLTSSDNPGVEGVFQCRVWAELNQADKQRYVSPIAFHKVFGK
jgi:hypothetical protein